METTQSLCLSDFSLTSLGGSWLRKAEGRLAALDPLPSAATRSPTLSAETATGFNPEGGPYGEESLRLNA
jgi:hypothetical protein